MNCMHALMQPPTIQVFKDGGVSTSNMGAQLSRPQWQLRAHCNRSGISSLGLKRLRRKRPNVGSLRPLSNRREVHFPYVHFHRPICGVTVQRSLNFYPVCIKELALGDAAAKSQSGVHAVNREAAHSAVSHWFHK
jgi:hypothetical protein